MLKKIISAFLGCALVACSTLPADKKESSTAAQINAQLALAYLDQHDVIRGKAKLLTAQTQAPSDPLIWSVTGYFLERTGDTATANQAYLHALNLAPHLGAAHNNYGAFLCRQGKYPTAIAHFLWAVADKNYLGTAGAYQNAGRCALKIPDKALAAQYFRLAEASRGG